MTIKELIQQLQTFDQTHTIEIEADYDCGYAKAGGKIDDVQFKDGKCILHSTDY